MYKSNRLVNFVLKYVFLLSSVILVFTYLYLSLIPNTEITINGHIEQSNFTNSSPFLIFGLLFSIPYFLYGKNIVYVEFNREIISIRKNRNTKDYTWQDVDSLSLSSLILPPTYKLKMKNSDNIYFFSSGMHGFAIPFQVWDFSKMGKFIKQKKTEYSL